MYRIEKPSIFIVSGGRTGTAFFTKLFNTSSNLTSAYHEPENIDYFNLTEIKTKSKHFGLCNLTVRKLCGRWGITNLSNQRMAGKISVTEAAQKLLDQRRTFIEGQDAEIYVESSYHFYGLIDIIPLIFENYKIVYIVRDPRDWVRSHMDKKEWYHFTNPATLFGTRISPRLIGDTRYTAQWKSMDRFEKLCWAWQMINSYALDMIKKTGSENIQYMRFEDIFAAGNKKEKMEQLLS
ncbi:sulfotransferase domain-containing protein, partial [candidate division KSB1 bacterium]|nr:sulfotransferase domain-containing protein [candidate division KSB1 bacterium]